MIKFFKKILFNLNPFYIEEDEWIDLRLNVYGAPIKQKSRISGLTRKVEVYPDYAVFAYRWVYSDGTKGGWLRMQDDTAANEENILEIVKCWDRIKGKIS